MIHSHEGDEKKFFSKIWDDKQINGRIEGSRPRRLAGTTRSRRDVNTGG